MSKTEIKTTEDFRDYLRNNQRLKNFRELLSIMKYLIDEKGEDFDMLTDTDRKLISGQADLNDEMKTWIDSMPKFEFSMLVMLSGTCFGHFPDLDFTPKKSGIAPLSFLTF